MAKRAASPDGGRNHTQTSKDPGLERIAVQTKVTESPESKEDFSRFVNSYLESLFNILQNIPQDFILDMTERGDPDQLGPMKQELNSMGPDMKGVIESLVTP